MTTYIDRDGQWIGRLKNWSRQKREILEALLSLERGAASPTAWDDRLEVGFFDVTAIGRRIYGGSVFTGGKLERNKRASLNRSLGDLYMDDFVEKIGNRYSGSGGSARELYKNNFAISTLGKKLLSSCQNKASSSWMKAHRFYDFRGMKVERSKVKRAAEGDYVEDWD